MIEFELRLQLDEHDFEKSSIKPKVVGLKKWLNADNILDVRRTIIAIKAGRKLNVTTINFTRDFESGEWIKKNYGGLGLDTVFQAALPTPIFIKAMPSEEQVETIINDILLAKASLNLKDKERERNLRLLEKRCVSYRINCIYPESIAAYKYEVNEQFRTLFPETEIELEEKDQIKWTPKSLEKKFSLHFQHKNTEGEHDESIPTTYNQIGHGAIRSAIFSLLLMKDVAEEFERVDDRKDYIVLFEEPELFLHPKLMKQLRSLIYQVSDTNTPYQVLCASHSPQMIDITKEKSSLVRMVKKDGNAELFQINDQFLKDSKGIKSKIELKEEMNELLRFNPFLCESFYADEVILVEGATEEIILRGYLSVIETSKDLFIVNCGTVNNIPFYQHIFSKFSIKYHVICDTDKSIQEGVDDFGLNKFNTGIQGSIYSQFVSDKAKEEYDPGLFLLNNPTFEPAHQTEMIIDDLKYPSDAPVSDGKPYNANLYWKNVLKPNIEKVEIDTVPIISFAKQIIDA